MVFTATVSWLLMLNIWNSWTRDGGPVKSTENTRTWIMNLPRIINVAYYPAVQSMVTNGGRQATRSFYRRPTQKRLNGFLKGLLSKHLIDKFLSLCLRVDVLHPGQPLVISIVKGYVRLINWPALSLSGWRKLMCYLVMGHQSLVINCYSFCLC